MEVRWDMAERPDIEGREHEEQNQMSST